MKFQRVVNEQIVSRKNGREERGPKEESSSGRWNGTKESRRCRRARGAQNYNDERMAGVSRTVIAPFRCLHKRSSRYSRAHRPLSTAAYPPGAHRTAPHPPSPRTSPRPLLYPTQTKDTPMSAHHLNTPHLRKPSRRKKKETPN